MAERETQISTNIGRAQRIAGADRDFIDRIVLDEIVERLGAINRDFTHCLTLGALAGWVPDRLKQAGDVETCTGATRTGQLEQIPAGCIDLAIGFPGMIRMGDISPLLAMVRKTLKPDGLFLAAIPAKGTLEELRQSMITAEAVLAGGGADRVWRFPDLAQCGSMLQTAGFALPVADIESYTLRYADVPSLLRDLRALGANSMERRSVPPLPRAIHAFLQTCYAERHADPDGRIRATLNLAYLSGWAPHESQQQPLRPGSGKMSLAAALQKKEPD